MEKEEGVVLSPPQNTEKIIDKIQSIILLEKDTVSEDIIDGNNLHQCISETKQILVDDNQNGDVSTDDENENTLNNTRAETFYKDAQQYWKQIPATIDGMLGGFSSINFTDIRGSQDFLKEIFKMKPSPNKNLVLDCGAGIFWLLVFRHLIYYITISGIGRVTKHLLIPIFHKVDVVEQDEHFANSVKEYVGNSPKLGTIYNQGLQEFQPESMRYDVIWSQWVLGHLTNDDFVNFFQRCGQALTKNGIVIVKENVTSTDAIDIDEVDSSVTRPLGMVKALFARSGLRIIKMVRQNNFPSGIFPVYMFAMKPMKRVV